MALIRSGLLYPPFSTISPMTMFPTQKVTMSPRNAATVLALLATTLGLAACGSSGGGSGSKHVAIVAYSTPQAAFAKLIPAFEATAAGKGSSFSQSYGGSGEQSRAVANGQHADVVNFSL